MYRIRINLSVDYKEVQFGDEKGTKDFFKKLMSAKGYFILEESIINTKNITSIVIYQNDSIYSYFDLFEKEIERQKLFKEEEEE